ncbi:hypothetical protein A6E15_05410 [Natrinema saccharevitans]|uniref:Uncharacterized protein n=1 Tax=Natrinema saccharevitans TaxID=301967 RepID=A0A1S8AU88_9EURY|nr:hypothetical protein [Natrinema saccharevitans]OLZ40458.1 hypothetical protein A6E15_05410 [Natrinema saccharevitans]
MVAAGMSAAGAETSDGEFTISNVRLKQTSAAHADRVAIEETAETSQLASVMAQETGRESSDKTISYHLEAEERDVREQAPALTIVPMKPGDKEWSELSISDVGLQFVLTAEENSTRSPVAAMGMSYRDSTPKTPDSDTVSTASNGLALDLYGQDETGSIGTVATQSVDGAASTAVPGSDGVSTAGLGCDGCKVVVGAICVGVNGTLGRSGCVSRCVPIVVSNPALGGGCAALCYALTSQLGKIACGSGGLSTAVCHTIDFC